MRTLIFALLLLMAGGVATPKPPQPWQPDADGDGLINIEDMVQFLTVFNTQWGPDLTVACDYQGTDLETLFADLMNGDAQLDSLYFRLQHLRQRPGLHARVSRSCHRLQPWWNAAGRSPVLST